MKIFEIIAILLPPIYGVWILDRRYELTNKKSCFQYFNLLMLSNFILNLIIYMLKDYEMYIFTISFFLKYMLLNVALTLILTLLVILLKDNVKINLELKNEKK